MRAFDYHRAWRVLKAGLAAAPLAPIVAPFVAAPARQPTAATAQIATVFTAGLTVALLFRAVRRSRREALLLLASTIGASGTAAHIIATRANSFFVADLLYEGSAAMLAVSAASAALRAAPRRGRLWTNPSSFSPHREVSDTVTQASAWLIVLFWMCVLAGLQYIAAVVLHVLGGTIMVTLLLRIVELTTAPDESRTP